MARRSNMVVLLMVLVAAALLQSSNAQTTHVVGDALGWLVPLAGSVAYSTWAATQTFTLGDSLVFNFTTGTHDVAEVTRSTFNSCNITTTINHITTGPARIILTTFDEHFYVCTFPQHCSFGQMLVINVIDTAYSPAPSSTPTLSGSAIPSSSSPGGSTASLPPATGGSTPSLTFVALLVTILSIAMAFFY